MGQKGGTTDNDSHFCEGTETVHATPSRTTVACFPQSE